jgi:hypothetical protein
MEFRFGYVPYARVHRFICSPLEYPHYINCWWPSASSDKQSTRLQTSQHIAWLTEYTHRAASVLYLSGAGGVTPPSGSTGAVGSVVPGWAPDLRRSEQRTTAAILVKF